MGRVDVERVRRRMAHCLRRVTISRVGDAVFPGRAGVAGVDNAGAQGGKPTDSFGRVVLRRFIVAEISSLQLARID